MKLKIYDKDGKPRELGPLSELVLAFDRNTFHVKYRLGNGSTVFEDGELTSLFPEGESPDFVFDFRFKLGVDFGKGVSSGVGHLVDPTSVSTGGLTKVVEDTKEDDVKKNSADELARINQRIKEINDKQEKPKEQPKSFTVPVASAVGHLTDPGSQETGKLDKSGNIEVPNAPENKQGTTKMEINK